ncbi:MAG TPA: hypothetical protein VFO70_09475, partial [Chitinophagaceae bacterium]|nr:hypothetical protein [Chitinophagaceae bacterium]
GKKGHGFFFGLAGSRAGINYKFNDPETGREDYQAVNGDLQFRLEGGYLFNSKPIFFKKSSSGSTDKMANESKSSTGSRKNCVSTSSHCMKSSFNSSRCGNESKTEKSQKSRGAWMRIQPSAGIGYSPFADNDILTKSSNGQTYYEYEADGWNSALITGVAFEFGHKTRSLISLSFNYFKSLGNSGVKTLNTVSGTKATTTTLDSKSAGWNIRVGIPFALDKQKAAVHKKPESTKKTSCNYYRIQYRCRKSI